MARIGNWAHEHPAGAVLLVVAVIAAAFAAATGAALATDRPGFCGAACHEMQPFHTAWSSGAHSEVGCVECHVEPGIPARLAHKTVALDELVVHMTRKPAFPLATATPVPDERCVRCHESVSALDPFFDHPAHANKGACTSCHADAGHKVTASALAAAGVLNSALDLSQVPTAPAVVDRGIANLEGHVPVSCTRCHDLAATGCEECHSPKHDAVQARTAAACTSCHQPGAAFAYAHPDDAGSCAICHDPPESDHSYPKTCEACHPSQTSWAFDHPSTSAKCTECHSPPKGHRSGDCRDCHRKVGDSWAFTHPSAKSTCTACHARPSGHRSGTCSRCHRAGGSWAFTHPSVRSTCTSCHARPSGHRSGACSRCHRAGGSWAFRHTSSACASCHRAPSRHFGSSCSSCHRAGRSWSSTSISSHPRIRGGEHSYRSFACSKCHPSGYSSATCSRCHKSSSGPSDDDEDDEDDD